jgi:hypothetical protein
MTGWQPTAEDLRLPWAPENQRERLRERLRPWLAKLHRVDGKAIGINPKRCFEIAQSLTATAQDSNVLYVEGVWDTEFRANKGCTPERHGWNSVHGIRVDLLAEFYDHDRVGFCATRHYEGLRAYTLEELRHVGSWSKLDSRDISGAQLLNDSVAFQAVLAKCNDEEMKKFWQEHIDEATEAAFQPAVDKFMARFANGKRDDMAEPTEETVSKDKLIMFKVYLEEPIDHEFTVNAVSADAAANQAAERARLEIVPKLLEPVFPETGITAVVYAVNSTQKKCRIQVKIKL